MQLLIVEELPRQKHQGRQFWQQFESNKRIFANYWTAVVTNQTNFSTPFTDAHMETRFCYICHFCNWAWHFYVVNNKFELTGKIHMISLENLHVFF